MTSGLEDVRQVSDAELVSRVERLVQADRAQLVKLLVHLAELDQRKLYRERGHSSMCAYCTAGLGMSGDEAYLRIRAARAGRRFPLVFERLASGAVHLTGIKQLAHLLTADNHKALLDRVQGWTKEQIATLVAELDPKPDAPSRLRRLPTKPARNSASSYIPPNTAAGTSLLASPQPSPAQSPAAQLAPIVQPSPAAQPASAVQLSPTTQPMPLSAASVLLQTSVASLRPEATAATGALDSQEPQVATQPGCAAATGMPLAAQAHPFVTSAAASDSTAAPAAPQSPQLVEPRNASSSRTFVLRPLEVRASTKALSPGRYKLEVTLGQKSYDSLQQLRELLRHQNPTGDLALIVERALHELLEREMKRRFAQTKPSTRRAARDQECSGQDASPRDQRAGADELPHACPSGDATMPLPQLDLAPGASSDVDPPRVGGAPVGCRASRADACDEVGGQRSGHHDGPVRRAGSRYIPRPVLREVYARDEGQCTFVSPDGRRCSARGFLEVHHHETPFARGGAATVDNLRLACRAHNLLFAERDYGQELMQQKLQAAASKSSGSAA